MLNRQRRAAVLEPKQIAAAVWVMAIMAQAQIQVAGAVEVEEAQEAQVVTLQAARVGLMQYQERLLLMQ